MVNINQERILQVLKTIIYHYNPPLSKPLFFAPHTSTGGNLIKSIPGVWKSFPLTLEVIKDVQFEQE